MGFFSAISGGISNLFGGGGSGSNGGAIGHAIDTTMDIGKTWLGYNMAKHQFKDQMALAWDQFRFQQDLVKKQMQWRVEDAKAAGLHPLAALGLSPSSFSPVSAGSPTAALDTSSLSGLGQNIDRAIMAGKNAQERQEAIDFLRADAELTLRNKQLNNELVETELADKRFRLQQQMFPPAPTVNSAPGLIGGQTDAVKIVPDEVIASGPSDSVTAGSHPLWTHARTGDFVMPVLSSSLADAVTENKEKNLAAELNYALAAWRGTLRPPMNSFTPLERSRLASGEYAAYYYPFMGWRVEPKMSFANFKKFVLGGYRSKKYRAPLKGDYYVKEVSGSLR